MKKEELKGQIRFALAQLTASNGVFVFENVCRHFARARINKNFIPATGPVQSGGDQGRDFETFHTYIKKSALSDQIFVGHFSELPIVGACSLQKKPIESNKITDDIETILSSGTTVDRIFFFSSQDIPIAKRHALQNKIKKDKAVNLEILDAQAISEHLTDKDLFWIAHEYLNIPIEYYPKLIEDSAYTNLKDQYLSDPVSEYSIESFVEIVNSLRYIYKNSDLVQDVPFWLKQLEFFETQTVSRKTQRNAVYEKAVVKIVSQNDVSGLESIILDYFSDFEEFNSPKEIEKAINLLSLTFSTRSLFGHNISKDYLETIKSTLVSTIETEIKTETENADRVCSYLSLKATCNLILSHNTDSFEHSIQEYCNTLDELITLLPNASLYPIGQLINFVNEQISMFLELKLDFDNLNKIVEQLESLNIENEGQFSIAESKIDRAIEFLRHGKPHKAIKILHEVKNNWFNEQTIKGAILASLLISDTYLSLGLHYASKYYALAAGHLAFRSEKDDLMRYVAESLKIAASNDYASGAWLNYLELIDLAINTYHLTIKDFNIYESDNTYSIVYYPAMIKYIDSRFNLGLTHFINFKISNWGYIKEDIDELMMMIANKFDLINDDDLMASILSQLNDVAFNDLGEFRKIQFNLYGIDFCIHFKNDFNSNALAEQFAGIFQIILGDLIEDDIHNLQVPVEINLKITKDDYTFSQVNSHEKSIWNVNYPINTKQNNEGIYSSQFKYIELFIAIFDDISLLNEKSILNLFEKKFQHEMLSSKTTFMNTYEHLFRSYYDEEAFNNSFRNRFSNNVISYNFSLRPNEHFKWKSEVSPLYNEVSSLEHISNRLKHKKPLSVTLATLLTNTEFKRTISKLRTEGHLDWQIYMSLVNIAVNYKMQKMENVPNTEVVLEDLQKYFSKDENEWYIELPFNLFNYANLKTNLDAMTLSTVLRSYQLKQKTGTPYFSQIRILLNHKFNYDKLGKEKSIFN